MGRSRQESFFVLSHQASFGAFDGEQSAIDGEVAAGYRALAPLDAGRERDHAALDVRPSEASASAHACKIGAAVQL